jgi:type II secretory pathway pseudopilin PulG
VLSPAAIAGISIAVVVAVALIAAAVFLKFKRRAVARSSTSNNIMMVEARVDVVALQQEVSAAEPPREDQSNALL